MVYSTMPTMTPRGTILINIPKLIEGEWRIYESVNLTAFIQIMACRLVGAKPSFEPMLEYQ